MPSTDLRISAFELRHHLNDVVEFWYNSFRTSFPGFCADARTARAEASTAFVVTVDTEADNEWEQQAEPTYENIRALPAFQELCDGYAVRPTYLVTYDVAADKDSLSVLRELLQDGNCEIGAHTHGWRTPPFYPPLDSDTLCHAYLYEYPPNLHADKVVTLTDHLEQVFQVKMTSHRAGRWGLDTYTLSLLEVNGYTVDTSVTPFRSWTHNKGDPAGRGGPDFLDAPHRPYYPASDDVCRRGNSKIREVPISIRIFSPVLGVNWGRRLARLFSGDGFARRAVRAVVRRLGVAELVSLNPATNTSRNIIRLVTELIHQNEPVLNMAFHSSELIAGGSPSVVGSGDEERVWGALEDVFACVSEYDSIRKQTLTEYARQYTLTDGKGSRPGSATAAGDECPGSNEL